MNFTFHNTLSLTFICFSLLLAGCDGDGGSSSDAEKPKDEEAATISAPQNLTATAGDTKIKLNWNSVAAATAYCVYVSDTAGINTDTAASYDIDLSTCLGSIDTNYTVTGLSNGTQYFFVVTAQNGSIESAASGEVSATPEKPFVTRPLNDTGITMCGNYGYSSGTHQNNLNREHGHREHGHPPHHQTLTPFSAISP